MADSVLPSCLQSTGTPIKGWFDPDPRSLGCVEQAEGCLGLPDGALICRLAGDQLCEDCIKVGCVALCPRGFKV
jgi:hypothetical protein